MNSSKDIRLGRLPEFDVRSRMFAAMRPEIETKPPISKTWDLDKLLDQGMTPRCVGYSAAHELRAGPVVVSATAQTADEIYFLAQKRDQYEGEDYDGTSLLGGAKAMKELGLIDGYEWCFGLRDLVMTVGYRGPVQIGINWYEGMSNPGPDGLMQPTGEMEGGHAIIVLGVNVDLKYAILPNTWGPRFGVNGTGFLTFSALEFLLSQHGEAIFLYDMAGK